MIQSKKHPGMENTALCMQSQNGYTAFKKFHFLYHFRILFNITLGLLPTST